MTDYTSAPEPAPHPSTEADGPTMHERIIEKIKARADFGIQKYGTGLREWNGRRPHIDLLDELLDAMVYAEQVGVERAAMLARIAALESMLGRVLNGSPGVRDEAVQVLGDRLPVDE